MKREIWNKISRRVYKITMSKTATLEIFLRSLLKLRNVVLISKILPTQIPMLPTLLRFDQLTNRTIFRNKLLIL